jgi:hypothetical protein
MTSDKAVAYLLSKQLTTTQSDGLLHECTDWKFVDLEEKVADQGKITTLPSWP